MTMHEDSLADAVEQFFDRVDAGDDPNPFEFEASLGSSFAAFLQAVQAKTALDAVIEPSTPVEPPSHVGRYALSRRLGRGGAGVRKRGGEATPGSVPWIGRGEGGTSSGASEISGIVGLRGAPQALHGASSSSMALPQSTHFETIDSLTSLTITGEAAGYTRTNPCRVANWSRPKGPSDKARTYRWTCFRTSLPPVRVAR